jgi:hypothetical protein
VQRALARRGLLGEHQAGEIDEPTSRALERFQRAQGLASTGFPDRATLRRLGIDPEQAYRAAHRPHPERPPQQGTGSGSSR